MSAQGDLDVFLHAAQAAYAAQVTDARAVSSLVRIFGALGGVIISGAPSPVRLPVCTYLPGALGVERLPEGPVRACVQAFAALEPALTWRRRGGDVRTANAAYPEGHANAMIVGPGGLVPHRHVWLGVTLLAPHVRYPDHTHKPEETYLVLSDGAFSQDDGPWFAPGAGGTFYNPPGILHAMRSDDAPLFAMWALWMD